VKANLFPSSHSAIPDWQLFPWHRDQHGRVQTHKPHSSQALAIDVFGAIKASKDCSLILSALARRCGIPDDGPWNLQLEWLTPKSLLGEITPTQIDAIAFGPRSAIVIEAKFTEGSGRCSQTTPIANGAHRGIRQCNGSYAIQTNKANGVVARCALSGKGIRYWEVIPELYGLHADTDFEPCPFAGDAFQWMRNVAVANRLSKTMDLASIVVVAFADRPGLATADKVRAGGLGHPSRAGTRLIVPLSYQAIVGVAHSVSSSPETWEALSAWIGRKLADVSA